MTTKKKTVTTNIYVKGRLINSTSKVLEEQAKSKPATILYKKLPDDMILITGFENFMGLDDIFDKYGRHIATLYDQYENHIFCHNDVLYIYGISLSCGGIVMIWQRLSKNEFSNLITHVKKCGGLLHDIILACNKGEVKRIEI
jgi:hypothetical protein